MTSPDSPALLSLRNITKKYPSVVANDKINLVLFTPFWGKMAQESLH